MPACCFSRDESVVFCSDQTGKMTLTAVKERCVIVQIGRGYIKTAMFSPTDSYLLVAIPHTILIFSMLDLAKVSELSSMIGVAGSYAFSHDSSLLVATALDCTARVYTLPACELKFSLTAVEPMCVATSPNSLFAVTAVGENAAAVWSLKNGKRIALLSGHSAAVGTVLFDTRYLVTASPYETIVWRRSDGARRSPTFALVHRIDHPSRGPALHTALPTVVLSHSILAHEYMNSVCLWQLDGEVRITSARTFGGHVTIRDISPTHGVVCVTYGDAMEMWYMRPDCPMWHYDRIWYSSAFLFLSDGERIAQVTRSGVCYRRLLT